MLLPLPFLYIVILMRILPIALILVILSLVTYCFMLGDAVISWRTQKQQSVAVSTTEAEYMALSLTSRQAVWYEHILNQIGHSTDINLYCDNQSGINIAENPVHHQRTKHIDVHYHYI